MMKRSAFKQIIKKVPTYIFILLIFRWYNDDAYVVVMNVGNSYQVVNLTAFDLVFGQLEVEVSSVHSSRSFRYISKKFVISTLTYSIENINLIVYFS